MTGSRWLIAVGAGRWQAPGISAARAAGINVLALDADSCAPGFECADKHAVVDIRDADASIAAIRRCGVRPDGAIAFCNEAGMLTAAGIREHFALPGAGIAVTRALTNKGVQRAMWTEAKVPGPKWFVVRSVREAENALHGIGGTAIMKPVDSAGSRGVSVLKPGDEPAAAFQRAVANSSVGEVIIESFITGVEHTVETFTQSGETHVLAITCKKKVPGTEGTVASDLETAQLDDPSFKRISSVVTTALSALGYTDGPGHTEVLLTEKNEIYLVEAAGRGGGFMVADGLVPRASGFNLARACALQAVGLEPGLPPKCNKQSVVLRFIPSRQGQVMSIEGFGPEHDIVGATSEPLTRVGQNVGAATSDGDRLAFILAHADTLSEARAIADERQKKIKIVIS